MSPWPVPVRRGAVALALLAPAFLIVESALAVKRGTAVECVHDGVRKRVEVVANPRPARACEVWYADTKTGWTNEIRWYAERDRNFCHSRADGLIAALARTGWVCDVIRKREVVVETSSEIETDRNHDTLPFDEMWNDDSMSDPEETGDGGGEPVVTVPRPSDSRATETMPKPGGLRDDPDRTGREPSLIVPPPRR